VEDGEIRKDVYGKTMYSHPDFDHEVLPDIREWFEQYYTIQFENYPVDMHYLPAAQRIPTANGGKPGRWANQAKRTDAPKLGAYGAIYTTGAEQLEHTQGLDGQQTLRSMAKNIEN